ncbi:MAG: hypothetical protein KC516_01015 [Nanoarchaeota archaeon]|nr:hypothetical protein [Nanoarchaeota archaeon]
MKKEAILLFLLIALIFGTNLIDGAAAPTNCGDGIIQFDEGEVCDGGGFEDPYCNSECGCNNPDFEVAFVEDKWETGCGYIFNPPNGGYVSTRDVFDIPVSGTGEIYLTIERSGDTQLCENFYLEYPFGENSKIYFYDPPGENFTFESNGTFNFLAGDDQPLNIVSFGCTCGGVSSVHVRNVCIWMPEEETFDSCEEVKSESICNSQIDTSAAKYSVNQRIRTILGNEEYESTYPAGFCESQITNGECTLDPTSCSCEWDSYTESCEPKYELISSEENCADFEGECLYSSLEVINECEDRGFLTYIWGRTWTGLVENTPAECVPVSGVILCETLIKFPLFGKINFLPSVLILAIVYFLVYRKRKLKASS